MSYVNIAYLWRHSAEVDTFEIRVQIFYYFYFQIDIFIQIIDF